jgi:hypothetical protein
MMIKIIIESLDAHNLHLIIGRLNHQFKNKLIPTDIKLFLDIFSPILDTSF